MHEGITAGTTYLFFLAFALGGGFLLLLDSSQTFLLLLLEPTMHCFFLLLDTSQVSFPGMVNTNLAFSSGSLNKVLAVLAQEVHSSLLLFLQQNIRVEVKLQFIQKGLNCR